MLIGRGISKPAQKIWRRLRRVCYNLGMKRRITVVPSVLLLCLWLQACGARDLGPCQPNPCDTDPRSTCQVLDGGKYSCQCRTGTAFDGVKCVSGVATNPCLPNPCSAANRTQCRVDGATFACDCNSGYLLQNDQCVLDTTPSACNPNPCTEANRAQCVLVDASYRCDCDSGYQLKDTACVAVTPCDPNPCTEAHRGQCAIVGQGYQCSCDPGYDDKNGACTIPDPCDPNPCSGTNKTRCDSTSGKAVCKCDVGYDASGDACVLVASCGNLYSSALGKTDTSLKSSLNSLTGKNFDGVSWEAAKGVILWTLDWKDGIVRGVYTGTEVAVTKGQLPNFSSEMNIEHTWPQSLGAEGVAKSDLHHLFPTVPLVNSSRSSLPYGVVTNISKCYDVNGKHDLCDFIEDVHSFVGYTAENVQSFEPPDEHKGDVARAMFYFAVRYQKSINGTEEKYLRLWHESDPVSSKEQKRNDDIETEQNNRNPFIDCPHFVKQISDF